MAVPTMASRRTNGGAAMGYEAELRVMINALRDSMDAAEYKHGMLGLIFLESISNAFEKPHAAVLAEWGEDAVEDHDEYVAENIFRVLQEAHRPYLKTWVKQSAMGQTVDRAMAAIERDNPELKQVLPKDYARPALDNQRLGQLIDLIGDIRVGDAEARSKDVLGCIYEYFLSQFTSTEGKRGGTAFSNILIYGQESNYTTWRLAKKNLAIRGIEEQIAHGDSFHNDRHPDLKADFILANSPST